MSWKLLIALALAAGPASTAGGQATGSPLAEIVSGPSGYVRVTEIGRPPLGMTGARAKAIARDNAKARAREKLLKALLAFTLADGRRLEHVLKEKPELRAGLRSVINSAAASDVGLDGDAVELTLIVRMAGETGLSSYLEGIQAPPPRAP
ncbi:MAG: hypothetical protein FJZ00_13350 [Candidatus Sericytochromatia bacterium]|uniref:Uncharacterized protein n=1 Tax=Candidatus Tanganyikabacteria bacterium TaxID=2961651 RepID=A0A937X6A5_9BACT|nr:hypothetical protein [Candidatus Tanganyikabacteria bacterium]